MRRHAALAIVGGVVLSVALASCGGSSFDLAAIKQAARSTPTEKTWRQRALAANPEHPPVPGSAIASAGKQLRQAVAAGGGEVVRLSFVWPAPDLVVATTNPAHYLKHGLTRLTRILADHNNLYLAVVDRSGKLVLEWSHVANSGSLYVRPDLEGCSPIVALGWFKTPPCPVA